MTDTAPLISTRTRVSPLWIIPIVALVAGIWMVVQSYLSEGPTITINFETAEGLTAGKTKVKMLSVEVGLVEAVSLNKDMSGVKVTISLEKAVAPLLREDTEFWVVRARVGAGGISGFNTLLSGGYIQLAPGTGSAGKRQFVGLETPPRTPVGAPGTRLALSSKEASIGAGDPIIYEGFKVGRVESMTFDPQRKLADYEIFIDAPYDQLVHDSTRFWNISGFGIDASAAGVELRVGTIDTILLGGVAFGTPPGLQEGDPVDDGATFKLYKSYEDILKSPFEHGTYFVVAFGQSLAGLAAGAPVTYRGIQLGRVERILMKEMTAGGIEGSGEDIPVLIYLEPGRLSLPDSEASVEALRKTIENGVDIR
jgi:paraquat-inducible protein B